MTLPVSSCTPFLNVFGEKGTAVPPPRYDFAELPRDSVKVEQMACWNTSVQKVLNQLMKESDNLNAEALLCRLGAQATERNRWRPKMGLSRL